LGDGLITGITSKRRSHAEALAVTEEELGPDVVAAAGRGSSQAGGFVTSTLPFRTLVRREPVALS
jgi:hypothetical protein